jgi:hypothetical protein
VRISVVVIALCALGGAARAQLLSPGPLAASHADIDGDDDCNQCHSSGKQVDAQKCLACHKDLGAKISAGRGLHGRSYKGKACEECHVEHNGRNYKLVRWPGGAMESLDHKDTGWPLEGAHTQPSCSKCHTQTTKGGKQTFLAARTDCGSCHKDAHQGRLGATCQQCHNVKKWEEVDLQKFDHAKTRYPLTGAHTTVDCAKCHGTPAKYAPLQFGTCDSCHKDPHVGQFPSKPCTKCHETSSWNTGADSAFSKDHPKLSLGGGHAGVKCEKCHDKGNAKPPSKGSTCVACHPQVHEAKFGNKCEQCHKSIRWLGLPRDVGLAAHDKTKYPLEGLHVQVDCAKCHSPKKPENERYRRLAIDACSRCHADPHQGELAALGKDCASCHTVRGYKPTTFTVADHARTKYPLDGRHAVTPCGSCHTTASPRVDLRVGKSACAECHQNPHGDQFAAEMQKGGCGQCHTSDRWQQAKIDHSTFPLRGAHARTACERCHGAVEKGAQPAAFRGVPRTCDGCHEDQHAGQFRASEPKKACEHCHTEDGFKLPDFDHAKETGYALEGKHAKVACGKCHPTEQLRNGATAVRYRLGYRGCKDCHANPHGEGL